METIIGNTNLVSMVCSICSDYIGHLRVSTAEEVRLILDSPSKCHICFLREQEKSIHPCYVCENGNNIRITKDEKGKIDELHFSKSFGDEWIIVNNKDIKKAISRAEGENDLQR